MGIASELIEAGWCQKSYQLADGSICLRTAARRAAIHNGIDIFEPRGPIYQALATACGDDSPFLAGLLFNDTDGRTYDEVLRAAKVADEILGW